MNAITAQIGDLAQSGERMIEQLRRKAFLPESREGLHVRFGIAEAAQLLVCSTKRIRMAEEDGRLPPAPPTDNGRRPGYTVDEMLNMRQVLGPAQSGGTGRRGCAGPPQRHRPVDPRHQRRDYRRDAGTAAGRLSGVGLSDAACQFSPLDRCRPGSHPGQLSKCVHRLRPAVRREEQASTISGGAFARAG